MKPSFILLPLSFILPSVFAACKTNEKYCGGNLRYQLGTHPSNGCSRFLLPSKIMSYSQIGNVDYREGQIISAAQQNTDLPSEARNDRTQNWENIIFNCVDGEKIEALKYCEDLDACTEGKDDGTGAECKLDL